MKTQITKKLVISNTVFSAVASIAMQVINFFILPLFIKNLGVELYGIWIISGVVIGWTGVLDFGFGGGVVRYVAKARQKNDQEELDRIIATGTVLFLVIGLVIGLMVILFRSQIAGFFNLEGAGRASAENILLISGVLSIPSWVMRVPNAVLTAAMRLKEKALSETVVRFIETLLLLAMVNASMDIVRIKVVVSIYTALMWVIPLYMVRRFTPEVKLRLSAFSFSSLHRMSGYSGGLFFSNAMGMLESRFDSLIISRVVGIAGVAPYMIACKFAELVKSYSVMVVSPLQATAHNLDESGDVATLQHYLDVAVLARSLLVTPVTVGLFIFMPELMTLWVGADFANTTTLYARIFLLIPFADILGVAVHMAVGRGKIKAVNWCTIPGYIANLVISIALAPYLGFAGPLLGTVFAKTFIGVPVYFGFLIKRCGLNPRESYRLYGVALSMGGVGSLAGMVVKNVIGAPWGSPLISILGFFLVTVCVGLTLLLLYSGFNSFQILRRSFVDVIVRPILSRLNTLGVGR